MPEYYKSVIVLPTVPPVENTDWVYRDQFMELFFELTEGDMRKRLEQFDIEIMDDLKFLKDIRKAAKG